MKIKMHPQPNEVTCGPTCLHSIYRYYNYDMELQQVIDECHSLDEGGTLGVFLGCHALRNGFKATIYTYNLQVFDPSWFHETCDLSAKLNLQKAFKKEPKLRKATGGYLEFLRLGGVVRFHDLTADLLADYLRAGVPVLTGLSATYLYHSKREYGAECDYDDIRGEPSGHFVVLNAYDEDSGEVSVVDPLYPNPLAEGQKYQVPLERVMGAILLGVLTYDANFLILEKQEDEVAL